MRVIHFLFKQTIVTTIFLSALGWYSAHAESSHVQVATKEKLSLKIDNAEDTLDIVQFGSNIANGGTGCPEGTYEVVTNGSELTILLNSLQAVANPGLTNNSSCNLRIPVSISQGYIIQNSRVLLLGFADIPKGGSGSIDIKVVAGTSVLGKQSAVFGASWSSEFQIGADINNEKLNSCQSPKNVTLGLNVNVIARATNAKTPATISITSQDQSEGAIKIILTPLSCK